ncbi:MAG: putative transposase [Cellvibrionaceae bacterium]|jgi:putative transposase
MEEGHLILGHVHICVSVPPKLAVSNVVGFIKVKSAISIARQFKGRQKSSSGEAFWARVYYVSTVGLDGGMIKESIHKQEKNDIHQD